MGIENEGVYMYSVMHMCMYDYDTAMQEIRIPKFCSVC